jgi:hypothetical protein
MTPQWKCTICNNIRDPEGRPQGLTDNPTAAAAKRWLRIKENRLQTRKTLKILD